VEGEALIKFMSQLNEYIGFFDKVEKRLRNTGVTEALAEIFAHEGKDPVKRSDFESPAKLKEIRGRLKDMVKTYQFRDVSEVLFDEEHNLYSVSFTDSQGAVRKVDWALASTPESRQMLSKYAQLKDKLQPPFYIEYAAKGSNKAEAEDEAEEAASEEGVAEIAAAPGEAKKRTKASHDPVEKKTVREVFDYVIEQGKKEYQVQRYKGLGEMTAEQLWETTMDPTRRTLLQVKLEDIAETETIFTTLMGDDVENRRKFIEENALDVKNLDI